MGNGRPGNLSPMRTAWPATRPAHSFFKFRAHPLNVLPTGFRFLDGEYPADPLIARERRKILPLCPRRRIRNEDFPQIRWDTVYHTRGDCFLAHGFHCTLPPQPLVLRLQNLWRVSNCKLSNGLNVPVTQFPEPVEMILRGQVARIGSADLATLQAKDLRLIGITTLLIPGFEIKPGYFVM